MYAHVCIIIILIASVVVLQFIVLVSTVFRYMPPHKIPHIYVRMFASICIYLYIFP